MLRKFVVILVFLSLWPGRDFAQAQGAVSRIFVTETDASSAPSIELTLYGLDSQGNAVDLAGQQFVVLHDGTPVDEIAIVGTNPSGTFTVFLLDIPSGVAGYLPTIQQAIQQFAAEPTMTEEVDFVAIYTVDELAATALLPPEGFHNAVQNAFATPLEPKSGPTALIDSTAGLLNNLDALKPRPNLVTNIVLMSDGTDAVSTQFEAGDVPRRAAELGVQVHTVWLDNPNVSINKQAGRDYMAQIAAGTSGVATTLGTAEELATLWQRIAAFRDQTIVRYTLEGLVGGDYEVQVSLAGNPGVSATATVTVPAAAPSIVIDLPEESRQWTLPNLDQPIDLSFSTTVSWLDGVDRQITRASLLVNGAVAQEIDVEKLERFDAQISTFNFGTNRIQVAVVDEEGGRATSPEIILTIAQGEEAIPPEVQPAGALDRLVDGVSQYAVYIGGCVIVVFFGILMILLTWATRRYRILSRLRLTSYLQRIPFLRPYMREVRQVERVGRRAGRAKRQLDRAKRESGRYKEEVKGTEKGKRTGPRTVAFLEVLESTTRMPSRIDLEGVELRLGRSDGQADIVFGKDSTVSRIHASLVQEGADFRIFDEQSTSGTWVNEQRVPNYGLQLVDGDEIRLGAVRLRFRQP